MRPQSDSPGHPDQYHGKTRQDVLELSQEETHKAVAEHEKAMQLLAAARVEGLRA